MDIGTIIIGVGGVIGIIAGIVQVIDFFQKQRQQRQSKKSSKRDIPTANVSDTNAHKSDILNIPENFPQKAEAFHNLPPRNEFVGRKDEIEKVHQALLSRPHIISIDGIGGVGKTALALEIAHECLNASKGDNVQNRTATFKGFVWITSKDHVLILDGLLDEVAQTLNHIVVMKQQLKEKRNSIIQLLQNTPSLLILDNYETITDSTIYDFLLEIPEPSKVLITTRIQKIGQTSAISLKGLPDLDALELIRSHGKNLDLEEITRASDTMLMRLCKSTEGHPLATKWALGQIKQKGQSLSTTLEFLENAHGNIFDQIFLNSWELLSQDARRVLRIMPIFTTDALKQSIEVASRLFGQDFDIATGQLTEMSLVNSIQTQNTSNTRYSIHPLTRAFAFSKLESESKIAHYAKRDLAFFFEEYTREHGGLWNLCGFDMIKSDISNIISIIRWCWKEQFTELGVNVFDNIRYFIINYGLWNTALELAFDAIKLFPIDIKSPPDQLTAWQTKIVAYRIWPIAWIYRFRGEYEAAKEEINLALSVFEHIDDKFNIAMAKRHLGLVLLKSGEYENAESFLQESLNFEKSRQDIYRIQLLTADLADLALQKGNLDGAWNLSKIILNPSHEIKDSQCIARFYRVLGSVARQQGKLEDAKDLCEKSLQHTEGLKYVDGIADASFELAQVEMEMGQKHEARQKYEQARTLYKSLGMEHRAQEIENIFTQLQESNNDNR
jgi:tetratricopeptide (TPR) repeat protein